MNCQLTALLLGVTALWGQDHPFDAGETLIYTTGFRLFSAARTIMEVMPTDTADPDEALRIVSRTETAPFFDRIYRIRDRVDLWLDPGSLELRRMVRDIHEGRFERQDTTIVDQESGLIYARRDTLTLEGPVFDPIGVIYYLRGLPLAVGDEIRLAIFDGRHLRRIAITVGGPERIRVPAGEFECLVLKPAPLDQRRLTKVDGLLHLWLANDKARTPVRLEQKSSFGTMVLKLLEVRK